MADLGGASSLVGRSRPLARLAEVIARATIEGRETALVAGQAGIGKTSLVRAATSAAGVRIGWGSCPDVQGAPGYWPWTQLLTGLITTVGGSTAKRLAGEDVALLSTIAPTLGRPEHSESPERARLLLMDATARFLDALASTGPVAVVLDDLQWADESSLVMLDFLCRTPGPAGLCLIGVYRHDEVTSRVRHRLAPIVSRAHHIELDGIDAEAVADLVEQVIGSTVDATTVEAIHRRTGGHPFFVRELALATGRGDGVENLPGAVRDALQRRVGRLSAPTRTILDAAAVEGGLLRSDVIAAAAGVSAIDVDVAVRDASTAGILVTGPDGSRFAHDLWREAILAGIDPPRRIALHRAIGVALEDRIARHGEAVPSEPARHFAAAVAVDGPDRATRWALEAAAADCAVFAFAEGAAQLRRLRSALAGAGVGIHDTRLVDVLLAESHALARAGSVSDARGLLRAARDLADRIGDRDRTGRVALASVALGARFAVRRDEIVAELEHALAAMGPDADPVLEAQLTAALARELQHSVADDRPRAGPLSERALELSRRTADPATIVACLLARHDVLWTPGTAGERADIAGEIAAVALAMGDPERHAEALLLQANALLEQGSAAHRAVLDGYLALLDRSGQPRHRYLAATRRACALLLRDHLDDAARMIDTAAALGERLREPDTGNVAMSQRLELVRARGDTAQLRAFADAAVRHWTGAPVHAHAVAAGFCARAGDLAASRSHVATVVDLGTWRADRSYLFSVLVRELADAASALQDADLCAQLLEDVAPLAGTCGVNGAAVAFAGSHAHTAGVLAAALGDRGRARAHFERAAATYRRLDARGWLRDVQRSLAELDAPPAATDTVDVSGAGGVLRRAGGLWHVRFAGHEATVAHCKGLADLARLLAAPNLDVHVLDLVASADRTAAGGALVDRRALAAYRGRLQDIDEDIDDARSRNDPHRVALLGAERQGLLEEIQRVTGAGGRRRQFANHPTERARKAVSGRIRDAIRRLRPVLPELATHLEHHIVTGAYCRYRGDDLPSWTVSASARPVDGPVHGTSRR